MTNLRMAVRYTLSILKKRAYMRPSGAIGILNAKFSFARNEAAGRCVCLRVPLRFSKRIAFENSSNLWGEWARQQQIKVSLRVMAVSPVDDSVPGL